MAHQGGPFDGVKCPGGMESDVESAETAALLRPARELLARTRVGAYLDARPVEERCSRPIVLDHEVTIKEALRVLADNNILSVPVADKANPNFYYGWLSVGDVVSQLLHELYPHLLKAERDTPAAMANALASDAVDVKAKMASWAKTAFLSQWIRTVKNVEGEQGDGDFIYRGFVNTSLLDITSKGLQRPCDAFTSSWGDMRPSHRVAVFTVEEVASGDDEDAEDMVIITDLIAQMDIVKFLVDHADKIGPLRDASVGSLNLCERSVLCVPAGMPTIAALALAHSMGVSGAGIIDNRGVLTGNISLSDLRVIQDEDDFDLLTVPVEQFKQACWPEQEWSWDAIYCTRNDTLLEVMRKMAGINHVHRVYVVDEKHCPTSVITLTDILRLVAIEPTDDSDSWLVSASRAPPGPSVHPLRKRAHAWKERVAGWCSIA